METVTLIYKTDKPNRNGLIYPKDVVRKALTEFTPIIEQGKALGTFGQDIATFDLMMNEVSHLITNYEEVTEGFKITAKILKTPRGIILNTLLDQFRKDDCNVEFGTRCTGDLEGNVIKNMKLISIDILPKESYKL